MTNQVDELERQNKALISYHSTLRSNKEYLKMEEIEKIQQDAVKDMKIMNEEIYIYFDNHLSKYLLNYERSTCVLDLGREVAALKVTLAEYENQISYKDSLIATLKSNISKAEDKIEDLMNIIQRPKVSKNISSDHLIQPVSPRSTSINAQTSDALKSMSVISQKLDNTYNLFKSIFSSIVSFE